MQIKLLGKAILKHFPKLKIQTVLNILQNK